MPVTVVHHPLIRHKLGLMRAHDISTKDFRELAAELACLLTYEATKDLPIETQEIQGWAGPITVERIKGIGLAAVLGVALNLLLPRKRH